MAEEWYNTSWQYRKKITIPSSLIHVTGGYVVNLNLTDSDLASYAQSNGQDILFTRSDGFNTRRYERVAFDSGTGQLVAAISPVAESGVDQVLYMYFGNAGAADQADASFQTNSFTLHLEEDPTGTAPQFKDSTTNGIDFTAQGTWASGDSVAMDIGNGLSFSGSNYISASSASANQLGAGDWTLIMRVTPSGLAPANALSTNQTYAAKFLDSNNYWYLRMRDVQRWQLTASVAGTLYTWFGDWGTDLVNGQESLVQFRYTASTATLEARVGKDTWDSYSEVSAPDMTLNADFLIGTANTAGANKWFWEGDIDEVRFYKGSVLSDNFLDTIADTEANQGSITVGSLESIGTITSVNSGNPIAPGDTVNAVVNGFTQAPDLVRITGGQVPVELGITQTISGTPTTTSVDFVVTLTDSNDAGHPYGTVVVEISNSVTGEIATKAVTMQPAGTNQYADVSGFPPPTGQLSVLDGSGAQTGDQYEIETPDGSTSFTANSDGTLEIEPDGSYTTRARGWDASDSTWGNYATININVVGGVVTSIRRGFTRNCSLPASQSSSSEVSV